MPLSLQELAKGRGRAFLKKAHQLGPVIAELQDTVEAHDVTLTNGAARVHARSIPVSFEASEVGTINLFFPSAVTISKARVAVSKALAGTDAGTIQLADNAGTSMGSGLLTVPLSSAIGTDVSVTPADHNVVVAGNKVQITTAKTTAGGKGILTLEYTFN